MPSSVANDALGTGTALSISQTTATSEAVSAAQTAAQKAGGIAVAVFEIDLSRTTSTGTEAVHNLSVAVTVTISLTDAQIAVIKASANPCIYYYDPNTGMLTNMNATFDLVKGTATFTTTHFSNYLLAIADRTPPVVSGIENNGVYNTDRTIIFNKGTATLDGAAFTSGGTASAEGKHTLIVTDAAGNSTTVDFVLDKSSPAVTLGAVKNGGITKSTVTVRVSDLFNVTTVVTRNSKAIAWPSNGVFTEDGKYAVTVTDPYGKVTKKAFAIDKTAPKITAKRGRNSVTVTVTEVNPSALTVTRNGKKLAWPRNNQFAKKGSYTVTATDKAGNKTTYRFKI